MSQVGTEVYLAYSMTNLSEEALNPKGKHIVIADPGPSVLACVGGLFMMAHPDNERECPYDKMTPEEVMESIVLIPIDSFSTSMGNPKRYLSWTSDIRVRSDGLTIERFVEHILTHETMHLVLNKLYELEASHQFDGLSRKVIQAKIGHSPYYTLGVHRS